MTEVFQSVLHSHLSSVKVSIDSKYVGVNNMTTGCESYKESNIICRHFLQGFLWCAYHGEIIIEMFGIYF